MLHNKMPLFALFGVLSGLLYVHFTKAQPAIAMEKDPATGKTRTLLAGQIKVPPDWSDRDMNVENNVFSASMAGTMKKGTAIPAQIADEGMWSTVSVPMTTRSKTIRCPQISLIKPPGGTNSGSIVVLPGILKPKTDLAAGSFVDSDGKHFHVSVSRSVTSGEIVPVLFVGDLAIFSAEPSGENSAEPWFTAVLPGHNWQTAIGAWRTSRCR